ncbi:MAG: GTPase HflX [Oscillospiraceae bacterium]|nr:GTPase HflX [Oscillospiraceae bacterium]MBR5252231.1 GTPase HflX [Oscillospiraceae bacterium]
MLTKTLIAGVDCGEYDIDNSMKELESLCEAGELQVLCQVVQKKDNPENKYYLGEGKLAEVRELCRNHQIELAVFDCELTGSQIKNISDFLEIEVIDRTMLILEIFSKRATTSEGKLQTELALLKYKLPRLSGMGTSLSRQGGGGTGGTGARRGAGESKLEYDRRHINQRIALIKEKLEQVEKRRDILSEKRKKNDIPVVALTGYTNVGKSSLLNKITDSEIFEKDMLFATLDPTARKFVLPSGQTAILVDTVGFVSRLPHKLVEAFKSTLKQAKYADIVLNVCDISSDDRDIQLDVTRTVLDEIGVDRDNIITVYNKCDKEHIDFVTENGVRVSAKSGFGLENLMKVIDEKLADRMEQLDILLPYSQTALINTIRENGVVHSEEYTADGIKVSGIVDKKLAYLYKSYKNNEI